MYANYCRERTSAIDSKVRFSLPVKTDRAPIDIGSVCIGIGERWRALGRCSAAGGRDRLPLIITGRPGG